MCVSQCLTRFKRKNTSAIPGSLGQAAPSQSNMPGTSGFGVYGVETTTGTIHRDLLLWTWVQKSPVKPPMDCNKIDSENAMPGSLHQHPEGLPMKQSSKQVTFLFKHRKVKEMILTQPTQPTASRIQFSYQMVAISHNFTKKSTCNYL